jgi:hypothetical protein
MDGPRCVVESEMSGRGEGEGEHCGVLSVRYADHFTPSTGPAEPVSDPVFTTGGRRALRDHSRCDPEIVALPTACNDLFAIVSADPARLQGEDLQEAHPSQGDAVQEGQGLARRPGKATIRP